MKLTLDYSDWAAPVENLGPGQRLILWVRGCPLACPGCMTPELWENAPANSHRDIGELADLLAPLLVGLDGLSISGGEPTLQAAPLAQLIRDLRARPELGELEVLSYSGFTIEELGERGADVDDYLAQLDILVDGRFVQSEANELAWRGSDNQRVHLLSARAQEQYADFVEAPMPSPRPLGVQAIDGGHYRLIGIPKRGDLAAYRASLAAAGLKVRIDMPAKSE